MNKKRAFYLGCVYLLIGAIIACILSIGFDLPSECAGPLGELFGVVAVFAAVFQSTEL